MIFSFGFSVPASSDWLLVPASSDWLLVPASSDWLLVPDLVLLTLSICLEVKRVKNFHSKDKQALISSSLHVCKRKHYIYILVNFETANTLIPLISLANSTAITIASARAKTANITLKATAAP